MNLHTEITNLEAILTNSSIPEYSPEELASMEEELFRLNHIESLWLEFNNIPMNPNLQITEQAWHGFPAGTHYDAIRDWFENEFHINTNNIMT